MTLAQDEVSQGQNPRPTATGARSILIVEDEMIAAESLRLDLEDHGYSVVGVARNRSEAREQARQGRPQLALVDVRLANGDDGIEVGAELKLAYGIDVLFVTATTDPETQSRAATAGACGFVQKPYLLSTLLRDVQRVLEDGR